LRMKREHRSLCVTSFAELITRAASSGGGGPSREGGGWTGGGGTSPQRGSAGGGAGGASLWRISRREAEPLRGGFHRLSFAPHRGPYQLVQRYQCPQCYWKQPRPEQAIRRSAWFGTLCGNPAVSPMKTGNAPIFHGPFTNLGKMVRSQKFVAKRNCRKKKIMPDRKQADGRMVVLRWGTYRRTCVRADGSWTTPRVLRRNTQGIVRRTHWLEPHTYPSDRSGRSPGPGCPALRRPGCRLRPGAHGTPVWNVPIR